MKKIKRTSEGEALTELVVALLRLNGFLLAEGDQLVGELGLTSARWQTLDAIVCAANLESVARLARNLGASRQNIQRIVNDLERDGFVTFEANPHHRRSPVVSISDEGRRVYDAAMDMQVPWVNKLAKGLIAEDVKRACGVLAAIQQKLASSSP